MKKTLLTFIGGLAIAPGFAQTATDFTVDDCAATSHTLFTELDAGKIVVLCWVMPCGACSSGGTMAEATVDGIGNPNVLFYVVDDLANTGCAALDSWISGEGMTPDASFSDAAISMTDYGTAGMPKVVVIGGASHTVYYNENNVIDTLELGDAINDAIAGVGINEITSMTDFSVFPNPANSNSTNLSFTIPSNSEVLVELIDLTGRVVSVVIDEKSLSGQVSRTIDLSGVLSGNYLIRLNVNGDVTTQKFSVAR